jgi:hypothetical protein
VSIYEAKQQCAAEEAAMREAIWTGRAPTREFYGELSARLYGFLPAWMAKQPDDLSRAVLLWPLDAEEGAAAEGAIVYANAKADFLGEHLQRVQVSGLCEADNPVAIVHDGVVLMGRHAPVLLGRRRQRFSKSRVIP